MAQRVMAPLLCVNREKCRLPWRAFGGRRLRGRRVPGGHDGTMSCGYFAFLGRGDLPFSVFFAGFAGGAFRGGP